jgi:hypothetical protein
MSLSRARGDTNPCNSLTVTDEELTYPEEHFRVCFFDATTTTTQTVVIPGIVTSFVKRAYDAIHHKHEQQQEQKAK